jgi:hypothetical protein
VGGKLVIRVLPEMGRKSDFTTEALRTRRKAGKSNPGFARMNTDRS